MLSTTSVYWNALRRVCSTAAIGAVLLLAACGGGESATNNPPEQPNPPGAPSPSPSPSNPELVTETYVDAVNVPWEIVFSPDNRMFFTEQAGRLRVVVNGQLVPEPVFTQQVVGEHRGMLGLALDPGFSSNGRMYVFYCQGDGCKLARLRESNNKATLEKIILTTPLPKAFHASGRMKFGPDGYLYVALGDFDERDLAQRLDSLGGKILRIDTEGNPAPGNPFSQAPLVWALGLRDPQGLAFDSGGNLYVTEHGEVSKDEINLVKAGDNFGWPICQGRCNDGRFVDPIRLFEPETAAPSGATFYNGNAIPQWKGSLLFATLGHPDNQYARHLHRMKFDRVGGTQITEEEILYRREFGRLRTVVEGPDGFVYFSTSNGGTPDRYDKIIRVKPR